MKYTYHFVTGETQEIEVDESQYLVLKESDRLEYNNDHANTRRHISLDMAMEDQGMQFADPATLEESEGIQRMASALAALTSEQRKLIQAIYFDGVTVNEYARREGVSQPAITQRLATAKKNLKKILSDPYI